MGSERDWGTSLGEATDGTGRLRDGQRLQWAMRFATRFGRFREECRGRCLACRPRGRRETRTGRRVRWRGGEADDRDGKGFDNDNDPWHRSIAVSILRTWPCHNAPVVNQHEGGGVEEESGLSLLWQG